MTENKLQGWWQALTNRLGLSAQPQQSPVHAALVAAASQVAQKAAPLQLADQALSDAPVVVYDLETSGLEPDRDTVLSIGAVTISNRSITLGQVFHEVLATTSVELNQESQLIHGLTLRDLAMGSPPRAALLRFLEYSSNRIWAAYHAGFDRIMLQKAMHHWLGVDFDPHPVDVAELAPMLFPDKGPALAPLDHWLDTFGLTVHERHSAMEDAMVTAEIMLIVLDRAIAQGYQTWGELDQACQSWRQLQKHLPPT